MAEYTQFVLPTRIGTAEQVLEGEWRYRKSLDTGRQMDGPTSHMFALVARNGPQRVYDSRPVCGAKVARGSTLGGRRRDCPKCKKRVLEALHWYGRLDDGGLH